MTIVLDLRRTRMLDKKIESSIIKLNLKVGILIYASMDQILAIQIKNFQLEK